MMDTDFDILVIGAGPAGLAAAQAAAGHGARIGIVDDNPAPGGQIWRQGPAHPPHGKARDMLRHLRACTDVVFLPSTRIVQVLAPGRLLVEDAVAGHVLHYRKLILCTGARERLLPFPGWTLPGVTGAGGLQALIKGGMPVGGQRIVVAGTGPLLLAAAAMAHAQGARVVAVVEQASAAAVARFAASLALAPAKAWQAAALRLALRRTPYLTGAHVIAAQGADGVEQVTVRRDGRDLVFACNRLACGYGLLPNLTLAQALGCDSCDSGDRGVRVDAMQRTSVVGVYAAGECTGIGGSELALAEGRIAGRAAATDTGPLPRESAARARWRRFAARLDTAFALAPVLRTLAQPDTIFCRCEDVPFGAIAEHASWRNAKLHTRCGMGPCQGRVCGGAAEFCFGWDVRGSRPPLSPARIGTLLCGATESTSMEHPR